MKILETAGYQKQEIGLPDLRRMMREFATDGGYWLTIIHFSVGRVLLDLGKHYMAHPDDFHLATWDDFAIVSMSRSRLTRRRFAALLRKAGASVADSMLDAPVLLLVPLSLTSEGIVLANAVFGSDSEKLHPGDLAIDE